MKLLRPVYAAAVALALSACQGNNLANVAGSPCNPGTQVQLAKPTPYQSNVSPNIGSIIIVANGNNNYLYNNYSSFNVTLFDQFGNEISGGPLSLVAYPNGPHPYSSDFYYQSNIGPLQYGMTYTAELTNVNMSPLSCETSLQSFST